MTSTETHHDLDRCVHQRCRIDPCRECGRDYEFGALVGPFIADSR